MKTIEEMTLKEIESLKEESLVAWYNHEVEQMKANRVAREVVENHYGDSIVSIYYKIEDAERKKTSEIFFSGNLVEMYPNIREQRAKKAITCDFSGGVIRPGSLYVSSRPLLKTLRDGKTYVLSRTIKVESGYWSELPTNIQELEALYTRAEVETSDGRGIEYSHFMQRMGGDFAFRELKGRRRK